jgi:hypothetical protein
MERKIANDVCVNDESNKSRKVENSVKMANVMANMIMENAMRNRKKISLRPFNKSLEIMEEWQ